MIFGVQIKKIGKVLITAKCVTILKLEKKNSENEPTLEPEPLTLL